MNELVVIVQPYVPHYRVPFFESLVHELAADGIICRVAAGDATGNQKLRDDASDRQPWMRSYVPKRIAAGRRAIDLGGAAKEWADATGVIVGLQGTLLDTYRALLGSGEKRVGLWGHVGSYVSPRNPLDHRLERWQARRADHIFAYTSSGSEQAARMGVDPDRITTVMNSMATTELLHEYASIQSEAIEEFETRYGLTKGKTIAYVGGIDENKHIDLLVDTLDLLWKHDPQIKLLIGGKGVLAHRFTRAMARGQAHHLGYADDKLLAMIGAVSSAITMPGRIGLISIQALALGLPILTTSFRYHAPEFEYLEEGRSVHLSKETPSEYAHLVHTHLANVGRVRPGSWTYPTLTGMVHNFAAGVRRMLVKDL